MTGLQPLPSDRSFGFLAVGIAAAGAGYLFWASRSLPWAWACAALALVLLATTIARPALLRPLNRAWMAMGALMARVVNPVVLGAMFFLLITPIALLLRASGRDALRLRSRKHLASYWIEREPRGPDAESFKNQF